MKFFDSFAVAPRDTDEGNRYGWLDEVESEEVSRALRSLSSQQIEILTLVAFEGYSATEAGRLLGMTQQGVSWHISKMKKNFEKSQKTTCDLAFPTGYPLRGMFPETPLGLPVHPPRDIEN